MGKSYTQPLESHPKWLPFLKPLLSGVFTADNMDYVLRDAYMCGVAVGPIDIERIIYYSFFSEKGLTLDRAGLQAFTMFLNARFYMYTNVYYHRTTRGIDLHLKEIFRDTMRIAFPYDLRKDLHPYLHLTEWTLLEDVGRWHDADDADRRALGAEWRHILDRQAQVADVGRGGARPVRGAQGPELPGRRDGREAGAHLPAGGAARRPVQDRHGAAGPAAAQPAQDGRPPDLRVRLRHGAVSEEPLTEILKYLPGKVAQCRIFAMNHEHDADLALALKRALSEEPPSIVTNV